MEVFVGLVDAVGWAGFPFFDFFAVHVGVFYDFVGGHDGGRGEGSVRMDCKSRFEGPCQWRVIWNGRPGKSVVVRSWYLSKKFEAHQ